MIGLARYVDRERDLLRNPWKRYIAKRQQRPAVVVAIREKLSAGGRHEEITIVPAIQIRANLSASPPVVQIIKPPPPIDPHLERLTECAREWSRKHG